MSPEVGSFLKVVGLKVTHCCCRANLDQTVSCVRRRAGRVHVYTHSQFCKLNFSVTVLFPVVSRGLWLSDEYKAGAIQNVA